MQPIELLSLISAISSIVLAIVALALALFFFVQTKGDAERSEGSAREISSSVQRLEKIFDSLYSDTFSMMRDTVSDMRKHVWTAVPVAVNEAGTVDTVVEDGASAQTLSPSDTETADLLARISEVSVKVGLTESLIQELSKELAPVIRKTFEESARRDDHNQSRSGASRPVDVSDLWRFLRRRAASLGKSVVTLPYLANSFGVEGSALVPALYSLASGGLITWEGAPKTLSSSAAIHLVEPDPKAHEASEPTQA